MNWFAMEHMDIACFSVGAQHGGGEDFGALARRLLAAVRLPEGRQALRLTFFSQICGSAEGGSQVHGSAGGDSSVNGDADYAAKVAVLERAVCERFGSLPLWPDEGRVMAGVESVPARVEAERLAGCSPHLTLPVVPVVTLVAEPPLGGGLAVEVFSAALSEGESVAQCRCNGHRYLLVEGADCSQIFSGGIFAAGQGCSDIYRRGMAAMYTVGGILAGHGFAPWHIVRQWNYIEDITASSGGRQHYQQFNDARAAFYAAAAWRDGYPAATGIGTAGGGVVVEFNAMRCNGDDKGGGKGAGRVRVSPLDNPLQVAAHAYSQGVLLGAAAGCAERPARRFAELPPCAIRRQPSADEPASVGELAQPAAVLGSTLAGTLCAPAAAEGMVRASTQKCTPKFERAKMIAISRGYLIYVSGTAAIRGEKSLARAGAAAQTAITMENIEELLALAHKKCGELHGAGGADYDDAGADNAAHASSRSGGDALRHGSTDASPANVGEAIPPPRLLNLRVYVKRPEDFAAVRDCLSARYPAVPILYLRADICRDELLVEIEATSTSFS